MIHYVSLAIYRSAAFVSEHIIVSVENVKVTCDELNISKRLTVLIKLKKRLPLYIIYTECFLLPADGNLWFTVLILHIMLIIMAYLATINSIKQMF